VAFGDHGSLSALVGCQRGRGTWKVSGRSDLQFGPLGLASSRCASDPVGSRVIADWRRVQSYVVRTVHLFLSLMGDGGVYEFEPCARPGRRKPADAVV
jgi:para-nitrobenzyl esterase